MLVSKAGVKLKPVFRRFAEREAVMSCSGATASTGQAEEAKPFMFTPDSKRGDGQMER